MFAWLISFIFRKYYNTKTLQLQLLVLIYTQKTDNSLHFYVITFKKGVNKSII